MRAESPHFDATPMFERRASKISDPVKRLRYLRRNISLAHPAMQPAKPRRIRHFGWLAVPVALALASGGGWSGGAETSVGERRLVPSLTETAAVPRVWRVERSETTDVYSNGLRVDRTFEVSNRRRANFPVFPLTGGPAPAKTGSAPVGIVYHTTESQVDRFEEDKTHRLNELGHNLLEVIRQKLAYHYVIDRFGRVFAVVEESDAANHAGNSIWADAEGGYVNLNDSFLGVAFEGQTGEAEQITPAQIRAAKVLTEMLRSRYGIAAANCVTHAQVSVNPRNMLMGEHTDWAANFPFEALGLPDNYAIPPASFSTYGFEYDAAFLHATQGRWTGLQLAREQIERRAAAENLAVPRYRALLQHRYKDLAAALKDKQRERTSDGDISEGDVSK